MTTNRDRWLSRDGLLLSLSAFFADLGYQGVTALYPLYIVLDLHKSPLIYGIITGLGFGVGSLFAFVGGWLGDRYNQKLIAIIGNVGILLLAFSGSTSNITISGAMFMAGWWFRYLRTPVRRAMLVQVTKPEYRTKVFGFLHTLDVGGGVLSVLLAIGLLWLHLSTGKVILLAAIPIAMSSLVLLPVSLSKLYPVRQSTTNTNTQSMASAHIRRRLFISILIAAGLYGFSFYNLGFPVLSAAKIGKIAIAGLAAYALYLGVSALSGWLLGRANLKGLRPLWRWGFLPSAVASLGIAINSFMHGNILGLYLAVSLLGLGMGAVETYEPALAASLRNNEDISRGMGWLSVARSLGQFGANFIMGALFVVGEGYAYLFAGAAALAAAIVIAVSEHQNQDK